MMQEVSLKKALEKYIAGKKVTVLQIEEDGRMEANDLSDFLDYKENHYLVDVPAVPNPDFQETVQKMIHEDIVQGEKLVIPEKDSEPAKKKRGRGRPKDPVDWEKVDHMIDAGCTREEIMESIGVARSTLNRHIRMKDDNRKHCMTCRYREKDANLGNCNYIGVTGHRRGCSVEECTKWKD